MTTNHTPGPWQWRLNRQTGSAMLVAAHSGILQVMGFERKGMHGAQPTVSVWPGQEQGEQRGRSGGIMTTAFDLFAFHRHPDARLMESAPELLEAVEAAMVCIAELPPTQARVEVMQLLQAAAAKATGSAA
ncbi:hypothetical protein HTY52_13010 [Cupriavidus taiwanensis]|uniref:hypothetical protein n=1 Tax=Cupriavidus taiwanensis TaxID=164546 RepID=UPI001573187D|nr:hypothetical protein [Cupriavidus taiwanensis]NSX14996.1 hypothetical protein [Cupriavidus taiwanensis]